MSSRPRALVISNIAWDFVWQRHQSMATLLADDYEVGFVELVGTRAPRWRDAGRILRHVAVATGRGERGEGDRKALPVWLTRPVVLPPTHAWMRAMNARLVARWIAREARLRAEFDLVVTYSQTRTALQILDRLKFARLVYDCTDDWLQVAGVSSSLAAEEGELLRRADLTLVPSRTLWERKQAGARRCEHLPHGAWVDRFEMPDKPVPPDGELTVLYYGHILDQHLDFAAIDALATARPRWRVVLVGPIKTRHAFPANVKLPGQVAHECLRDWLQNADVVLLPYAINDYTAAVMPAKTYEVLATGRPIVAAPLPALQRFGTEVMCFARAPEEWASTVESAIAADSADIRHRRRELARANSWPARYRELQTLLARVGKEPDGR